MSDRECACRKDRSSQQMVIVDMVQELEKARGMAVRSDVYHSRRVCDNVSQKESRRVRETTH